MVYFPERQPDGSWAARPVFTNRVTHTAGFMVDDDEFARTPSTAGARRPR